MTRETAAQIAARWGIDSAAIPGLERLLDNTRQTYARVEALAEALSEPPPPSPGWRVEAVRGSDPTRAWMFRTFPVAPSPTGPLSGQRLVVKDAIAVGGVPMTLGSNLLAGHVPDHSATAVERALSAGATLAGTAVCEDMCYSGSSFTSATGPVPNPYDRARSAGGSTSGCGALIASGEADLGLGTDLGGSVRNPAAWCGICGLKPTFGVVPYTGAAATEVTMDHLGLMARTAREIAVLLDAVAGPDDQDPRQAGAGVLRGSAAGIEAEPSGMRVGLLREGFGWPNRSDPRQDELVEGAIERMAELGVSIGEVSVPLFRSGTDIHVPIATEGGLATVFETALQGANHAGFYDPALAREFGNALRERPADLPLNGKVTVIAATLMRQQTNGRVMALAQALRRKLRNQIDAALAEYDVLALPTTPMLPHLLPEGALTSDAHQQLAFEMHDNNCVANLTGHPALSVPCGMIDGLPVGLLLIGPMLEDHELLRLAHHFQARLFAPPTPKTEMNP
ncbi:hypothetical protein VW29_04285 [Devosia limi DSM 17137]|uniref:Amidase n=1 Tax=Devosia limi DSM 17137 TaxID=1121477 RepID=A0A0F5LUR6_9HYPH|nr:amidase family protein [Devosia limi]KKB86105.1 hypothetical protein VW29_04285 [Devosia limi DSM 17137]SHF85339.1 amidase [Devosia limi DSM 17137]